MTDVLDLIDDTTADWRGSPDAYHWSPEPLYPPRPDGRVPYLRLTEAECEQVHDWLRLHQVDHRRVPLDALFDLDTVTREWRITVFKLRNGRPYLASEDEVATATVRRAERAPLPWPMAASDGEAGR